MFVNYYAVLEIDIRSNSEEIKAAFKRQALKWHPDKNPGLDTTEKMQLINEAKLILLDAEAREKYNVEYLLFRESRKETSYQPHSNFNETKNQYTDYAINDEVLKKWMENARRQAISLAKQTIEDFKGMATSGAKAAVKAGGNALFYQLLFGVIILIIFGLGKSCYKNQESQLKQNLNTSVVPYKPFNPIPFDPNNTSFLNYNIGNQVMISIPSNMELKSDLQYNQITKNANESEYFINSNQAIFQQKGLMSRSKEALTSYVRIIVSVINGNVDSLKTITDTTSYSIEDTTQLSLQFKQQLVSFEGGRLIEWYGVLPIIFKNYHGIRISYLRQLKNNSPTHVDLFYFKSSQLSYTLSFSYHTDEFEKWDALLMKSLNSFKITTM